MSRWYLVCSAEYGVTIPILDDGSGPKEYGRDCIYVRAANGKRAKVVAVRTLRRTWKFARCAIHLPVEAARYGLTKVLGGGVSRGE